MCGGVLFENAASVERTSSSTGALGAIAASITSGAFLDAGIHVNRAVDTDLGAHTELAIAAAIAIRASAAVAATPAAGLIPADDRLVEITTGIGLSLGGGVPGRMGSDGFGIGSEEEIAEHGNYENNYEELMMPFMMIIFFVEVVVFLLTSLLYFRRKELLSTGSKRNEAYKIPAARLRRPPVFNRYDRSFPNRVFRKEAQAAFREEAISPRLLS